MDQKSDVIKEDIEETRAHLAEKLNTLEDELRDRVETAKEKLRQFNPRHQIYSHPLAALGGSVVAGLAAGYWVGGRGGNARSFAAASSASVDELGEEVLQTSPYEATASIRANRENRENRLSPLWQKLNESFGDEIELVKGMALGAFVNTARQAAKQVAPNLSQQIDKVADSVCNKYGVEEPQTKGSSQPSSRFGSERESGSNL